jgi:hypothetical protein
MLSNPLRNIPLQTFRNFLAYKGLSNTGGMGGHEKRVKSGLLRPVVIQTHVDPVPEFIVKNALSTIGATKKELHDFIKPQRNTESQ